jgi:hypothetical protein
VILPLAVVVVVLAVVLAGWAALWAIRDKAVVLNQLWGSSVVETALLVQLVVAIVTAARGPGPVEHGTFWGYAVAIMLILPLAGAWAFAERTRWSSVVLLVAAVTVAFMQWRMLQTWGIS